MRKLDLTAASYIIFDEKVLLIHHAKLDMWLPVGGHIDPGETPDQTAVREAFEETGLKISPIDFSNLPHESDQKKTALPFDTNVHSVGDHDHYCLFFVCDVTNPEEISINKELKGYRWFEKQELIEADLNCPSVTKAQAIEAINIWKRHKSR